MTQLLFFRLQIISTEASGRHLNRHHSGHLNAGPFKSLHLVRVIGKEANPEETKVLEDLSTSRIISLIVSKTQLSIGLNGIGALVLKFVSPELIQNSDATSFFRMIDNCTVACPLDSTHGHFKLITAITTKGRKHIPGQTLGMDTNQRLRRQFGSQFQQNHVSPPLASNRSFVSDNLKTPQSRRQNRSGHPFYFDFPSHT